MEVRSPTVQWLAYLLISTSCILLPSTAPAQSPPLPSDRARIALYEPSGPSADTAPTAALRTVTDSVELSLLILGRYDVRRLGAADPEADIADIRAYCQDNRIDQAVLVSGRRNPGGGYTVRLEVYDRPKDGITIDREGSAAGALDLFDATDSLVASLVDGLSGSHILFGSLQVDTDPPGALVAVNGHEVGPSPLRLRGLPAGTLQVSARSPGRETVDSATTIRDGETTTATLKLPRSTGTLQVDGKTVATGRIERTLPFRMSLDETLDCGEDTGTPVSEDYQVPFKFTGDLKKVTIDLTPTPLTAEDDRSLEEGAAAIGVAE